DQRLGARAKRASADGLDPRAQHARAALRDGRGLPRGGALAPLRRPRRRRGGSSAGGEICGTWSSCNSELLNVVYIIVGEGLQDVVSRHRRTSNTSNLI